MRTPRFRAHHDTVDINMPGLDGLAVVRRMRTQELATELIILTIYKEEDLFNAAMDLDVEGCVLKEDLSQLSALLPTLQPSPWSATAAEPHRENHPGISRSQ